MLVHSKKAFLLLSIWPGTEYTWHSFQRRGDWFVVKATRVFPIPTQAKLTEDCEHFAYG